MMESMDAQAGQNKPTSATEDASNPFGASASAMFNDFERVKTEESKKAASTGAASGSSGELPPGMNDADLNNLEKQFTGMF